jgi:hypothetical protein
MISTPSLAHEGGISSFTIAPIVVRMKFVASVNVHEKRAKHRVPDRSEHAPDRMPDPEDVAKRERRATVPASRIRRRRDEQQQPCCEQARAADEHHRTHGHQAVAVGRGSGQDRRDQNEDHDDPASDAKQLLRRADVPEHHHPRRRIAGPRTGLGAVVAGEIKLHQRVVLLEGTVAVLIAIVCLGVLLGGPEPGVGLLVAPAVLVPYRVVSGVSPKRLGELGVSGGWARWLSEAVLEEEQELELAIHPSRAGTLDVSVAVLATAVVVSASIAMELTASKLGARHHVPEIVIGALVLAGVTSLPKCRLRAVSGRPRPGCSDAQHCAEQQRPERYRRPAAPRDPRRAGPALMARDPRCCLVSRSDRGDVGLRVYRSRAAPIPRRADHRRLPRVRRSRTHNELIAGRPYGSTRPRGGQGDPVVSAWVRRWR